MTVREKEIAAFRREHLGFVFQDFHLLDNFSLKDNIFLPLVLSNVPYKQMNEWLYPIAQKLGIVDILEKYPYEVSGGQKQRAAVARAIITKPELILADEPIGNLDYQTGQEIMKLICASRELYRQTIVMVTHDMDSANYADRIVYMEDGALR